MPHLILHLCFANVMKYVETFLNNKHPLNQPTEGARYSLRPKILVILAFKFYPKKHIILLYLESACTCKNQLVPNMDNK